MKRRKKRNVVREYQLRYLIVAVEQFLEAGTEAWTQRKSWDDILIHCLAIKFAGQFYLGLTSVRTKVASGIPSPDLLEFRHRDIEYQIHRLMLKALEIEDPDRSSFWCFLNLAGSIQSFIKSLAAQSVSPPGDEENEVVSKGTSHHERLPLRWPMAW